MKDDKVVKERREHILILNDACADALRLNAEILAEIAKSVKGLADSMASIGDLKGRLVILESRMDKAAKIVAKIKATTK